MRPVCEDFASVGGLAYVGDPRVSVGALPAPTRAACDATEGKLVGLRVRVRWSAVGVEGVEGGRSKMCCPVPLATAC